MNIKFALLSGVAMLATGSAMAADLPSVKSAPVQYVRICDAYGRGFFYIPGTQTCLRLGGYVRSEYSVLQVKNAYNALSNITNPGFNTANTTFTANSTATFTNKNGIDALGWEMRGVFDVDARTATSWGTARTFMRLRLTSASGLYNTGYNTAGYSGSNAFSVTLIRAFVQFAGFTFGRSGSLFNYDSYDQYASHRRPGFSNGTKQLAYTATFGKGFSATVGIEDPADFNAARSGAGLAANGLNSTFPVRTTAVGPQRMPAFAANFRIDQDWGSLQFSAQAIQNTSNIAAPLSATLNAINGNGPLVKKWGYAVGIGGTIKLDALSPGDNIMFTATMGKGAMDTVSNFSTSAITSDLGHILTGLTRVDNNMYVYGVGPAGSAVRAELTKAWALSAVFRHFWTPTVASYFGASYLNVTPGAVTRSTDWQGGGLSKANAWTLSKALVWYPIQGFELGAEVAYYKLNQSVAANPGAIPSGVAIAAACPGGVAGCSPLAANFKVDPNAWRFVARAERRF